MNSKVRHILIILAIVLYACVGIYYINYVTKWSTERYYNLMGTKALDIAKIVAVDYQITDAEVQELKGLTFREVLEHPANIRLNSLFSRGNFSDDLKYAYIMVMLEPDEFKYYVDESNAEYFGVKPGTPLNLLWLIDTVIEEHQQKEVSTITDYYDDINRYSCMSEEDLYAYQNKNSMYIMSNDQYGNAFTGLAPIYSVEGTFVGLMGVDIYYEQFASYVDNFRLLLAVIFLLPTVILTLAYVMIYTKRIRQSNKTANTDPLTSLYNRRYLETIFVKIIKESYQRQLPVSVIMIDIDFFKNYNDTYGHQKGDEALIGIAQAILSVLRDNDTVCRYGGEEMIVILPTTDLAGAVMVAEKIKLAIGNLELPHSNSSVAEVVTVSQGIYTGIPVSTDGANTNDFIINADKALYKAKESGRNCYIVYSDSLDNN